MLGGKATPAAWATLPALTAAVYRIRYQDGKLILRDPGKDWSANFAHTMGVFELRVKAFLDS